MEFTLQNGFKKLKRDQKFLIFDYLDNIDIIKIKNLNIISKQYFISKLDILRIFQYILNHGKIFNDTHHNKIRILNLMTNSEFIQRATNLFKIEESIVIETCYKLAKHYLKLELKDFN